jgi:hypothetical protein
MDAKAFRYIFNEQERRNKILFQFLHHTKPDTPASSAFTTGSYLFWCLIQAGLFYALFYSQQDFQMKVSLRRAQNSMNAYSVLDFAIFVSILFLCFGVFCVVNITMMLRRISQKTESVSNLRNSYKSFVLKKINGVFLLGWSNLSWLLLIVTLKFPEQGVLIDWPLETLQLILFIFGSMGTFYSFLLFYFCMPFFPKISQTTFKVNYFLELSNFCFMIFFMITYWISDWIRQDLLAFFQFGFVCASLVVTKNIFSYPFLDDKVHKVIAGLQTTLTTYFIQSFISQVFKLGSFGGTMIIVSLLSILGFQVYLRTFQRKFIIVNKIQNLKGRSISSLVQLIFKVKYYCSLDFEKSNLNSLKFKSEMFEVLRLCSHPLKNCNIITCVCRANETQEFTKRKPTYELFNSFSKKEFIREIFYQLVSQNRKNSELIIWYLKLLVIGFKNYNLMLIESHLLERQNLSWRNDFQLFSLEEEVIYHWRYKDNNLVNFNSTNIGIFKFVNFSLSFHELKKKAFKVLKYYLDIMSILSQSKPSLIEISSKNNSYYNAKKEYIIMQAGLSNNSFLNKFHERMSYICLPELNKTEISKDFSSNDITGTKIIYSSSSSYIFVSLDNGKRGEIINANPNIENLVGYRADTLIGTLIDNLLPNDIARNHDIFLLNYLRTGKQVFVNKMTELFLINNKKYMVPVTIYMKNFLNCGNSSACVLTFFRLREEKRDFIFCNSQGKILNTSERFSSIVGLRRISEGSRDLLIQVLIPRVFSIMLSVELARSLSEIQAEIDKLKDKTKNCNAMLYMVPKNDFKDSLSGDKNDQEIHRIRAILEKNQLSKFFTAILSEIESNQKKILVKYKIRFDIQIISTSVGPFFLFPITSIAQIPFLLDRITKPHLSIFRISSLYLFVKNISNINARKYIKTIFGYGKSTSQLNKNLLTLNTKQFLVVEKIIMPKPARRVDNIGLVDLDVVIEKKLYLLKTLAIIKILVAIIMYIIVFSWMNTLRQKLKHGINDSFLVSSKINNIFNSLYLIPLVSEDPIILQSLGFAGSDSSLGNKQQNIQKFDNIKTENSYFEILKKDYTLNIFETEHVNDSVNSISQTLNSNNFSIILTKFMHAFNSNFYDIFIQFGYWTHKPSIGFNEYHLIRQNLYAFLDNYQQMSTREFQISLDEVNEAIPYLMYAMSGTVFVFFSIVFVLYVCIMLKLNYSLTFSSLISIGNKKIHSIKMFICAHEFGGYFSLNIFKHINTDDKRSNNLKNPLKIPRKGMLFMILLLFISLIPSLIQVLYFRLLIQSLFIQSTSIIENVVGLDFLLTRAMNVIEDKNYATQEFFDTFNSNFPRLSENLMHLSSRSQFIDFAELHLDDDLCLLLVDIDKQFCDKTNSQVFSKGLETLGNILWKDIHTVLAAEGGLFETDNYQELLIQSIGFSHVLQRIWKHCVSKTEDEYLRLSYIFITLTGVIGVLMAALCAFAYRKFSDSLAEEMRKNLTLLLLIKPNVRQMNSKLLKIFK